VDLRFDGLAFAGFLVGLAHEFGALFIQFLNLVVELGALSAFVLHFARQLGTVLAVGALGTLLRNFLTFQGFLALNQLFGLCMFGVGLMDEFFFFVLELRCALLVGFVLGAGSGIVLMFVLRRRRPDMPRPYRAFGYPVLPALYIVLAVAMAMIVVPPLLQLIASRKGGAVPAKAA